MNYFEFFELPLSYDIDPQALKIRYYKISKDKHPDRYATADDDTRTLAEQEYSEINKAYETLQDDQLRLEYILTLLDIIETEESYELPPDFLMEMLELNELNLDEPEAASDKIQEGYQALNQELNRLMQKSNLMELSKDQKNELKEIYYKSKYYNRLK